MPKNLIMRGCTLLGLLLIVCALAVRPAHGQIATAPELKAAFLLNFVKFTTWPSRTPSGDAEIALCVVGDPRVAGALDQLTRAVLVDNRSLVVRRLDDRDDPEQCHLLYVSGLDSEREQRLIRITRARPILTASDSSSFMAHGGVAAFHMNAGRMRFSVNPAAAERAQLKISSRLLSLAQIVEDKTQ